VQKGSGPTAVPMGTIEAVNFFGEMGMINEEPRNATVRAHSEEVVVYRIANPSIHTILTNPLWAELLISRLARNLARCIEKSSAAEAKVKELEAELSRSGGRHSP